MSQLPNPRGATRRYTLDSFTSLYDVRGLPPNIKSSRVILREGPKHEHFPMGKGLYIYPSGFLWKMDYTRWRMMIVKITFGLDHKRSFKRKTEPLSKKPYLMFLQIVKNTIDGMSAPPRLISKEKMVNRKIIDLRTSNRYEYSYYLEDGSFWKLDVNEHNIVPFYGKNITNLNNVWENLKLDSDDIMMKRIEVGFPIALEKFVNYIRDSTTPFNPLWKLWKGEKLGVEDRNDVIRQREYLKSGVHKCTMQTFAVSLDKKSQEVSFLGGYETEVDYQIDRNPGVKLAVTPLKEFTQELFNCVHAWNIESDRKFKGKSLQIKLV